MFPIKPAMVPFRHIFKIIWGVYSDILLWSFHLDAKV